MNKTTWIWKESNGQKYLEVSASSPYELGVAIGHGLAKKIGFTYRMQMMAHGKVKALSQEICSPRSPEEIYATFANGEMK